jgi:putative salt-induced outer membrane protein YdiY
VSSKPTPTAFAATHKLLDVMLSNDLSIIAFSPSDPGSIQGNRGASWSVGGRLPRMPAARCSKLAVGRAQMLGAALALALLAQPAAADTVVMRNGDRFTGEVVRQAGGELQVRTAYAGLITVDFAQVSEVRLDTPVPVLLDDERVVSVAALTRYDDALRLETPARREPMTVSPDRVRVVHPEPWETGDGGKFSGQINLGLEDETGNSDSTELDLDTTLRYRRRWHELETFGQLEYDTTNGKKSTDNWKLNSKYSHFFRNTPWYGAAWLRLKNDRFADVRLRTIAAPALGYAFEAGGARLSVEVGPTYVNEDYYVHENASYWGPGLFVDYAQGLFGNRVEVYLHGMGFTSWSDENKDLMVSWAGLRIPLSGGFVGSIEYEIDHDDPPAVNAKPTDETVRLKLGYEW